MDFFDSLVRCIHRSDLVFELGVVDFDCHSISTRDLIWHQSSHAMLTPVHIFYDHYHG